MTLSRFQRLSQAAQSVGLYLHLAEEGVLAQAVDGLDAGRREPGLYLAPRRLRPALRYLVLLAG